MHLEAGTVVDRYTIERTLGQGTFARVYRARHNQLGSHHALKVLQLDHPKIRERFLLEGRVQAGFRHPNLTAVTDVLEVGGALALVLDLVEGPTLDALLASEKLTPVQIDSLARGLLEGVAHAHRAGLVHRDLKPQNVLVEVTPRGLVAKVTDFGLAKVLGAEDHRPYATRTGAQLGTPNYMAPEQVRDSKSVDARADVFALGAVLYEMLTGRRAFPQEDMIELYRAIAGAAIVPLPPTTPERMRRAVEGALVADPQRRFADAEALLRAWCGDLVPARAVPEVFDRALLERVGRSAGVAFPALETPAIEVLRPIGGTHDGPPSEDDEIPTQFYRAGSHLPDPPVGPDFAARIVGDERTEPPTHNEPTTVLLRPGAHQPLRRSDDAQRAEVQTVVVVPDRRPATRSWGVAFLLVAAGLLTVGLPLAVTLGTWFLSPSTP